MEIFLDPPQKKLNTQKLRPTQKMLTHGKNVDSRKNVFDPHNSRKNYEPRNILTHVKDNLTHVTDKKIWPT